MNSEENKPQTFEELADQLGIAKSTIYRWRTDGWGIDDLNDGTGWNVEEVREWSKEMKRARRAILRPPMEASLDDGDEDPRDYGALYRKFKALKEGINLKQLQGSLVEKAEVETMMAMRISELTTALDSLAAQLAPRLAPLTRESEIQGVLRSAFHELRDHFARGSTD
ncbi:helix-turn-helix domain-containing protein [Planctomycetota bacterium]|nr:helix-turn-helix domain-containing protein [Planctomycetota bacterium]